MACIRRSRRNASVLHTCETYAIFVGAIATAFAVAMVHSKNGHDLRRMLTPSRFAAAARTSTTATVPAAASFSLYGRKVFKDYIDDGSGSGTSADSLVTATGAGGSVDGKGLPSPPVMKEPSPSARSNGDGSGSGSGQSRFRFGRGDAAVRGSTRARRAAEGSTVPTPAPAAPTAAADIPSLASASLPPPAPITLAPVAVVKATPAPTAKATATEPPVQANPKPSAPPPTPAPTAPQPSPDEGGGSPPVSVERTSAPTVRNADNGDATPQATGVPSPSGTSTPAPEATMPDGAFPDGDGASTSDAGTVAPAPIEQVVNGGGGSAPVSGSSLTDAELRGIIVGAIVIGAVAVAVVLAACFANRITYVVSALEGESDKERRGKARDRARAKKELPRFRTMADELRREA